MEKKLILNASSRKNGTSAMLCRQIQEVAGGKIFHLFDHIGHTEELLSAVDQAETIVISGPCYVDSYPAVVVAFLEEIAGRPEICHGQKLYGVINGGMPYVHTHECGLWMLELFCKDCGMEYQGGFVLGLGPMLNGAPLDKHVNARKVVPTFAEFCQGIRQGEKTEPALYRKAEVRVPVLMARAMSFSMNRMLNRKLKKKGFDPKAASPYLEG